MTNWNYADVWETVAGIQPEAPAITQGKTTATWGEFDLRAEGIARYLLDLAPERQDKVALYLYNSPEYLEASFGIMKISLVPVNTNYRYADDELVYLWDNADAIAIVFHGTFAERIDRIRDRVPKVRAWIHVDDGSGACPDWATPYEAVAAMGDAEVRVSAGWERSGDDLYMLYTGGTTGMPKGVMWRQDDLFARLNVSGFRKFPEDRALDGVAEIISGGPGMSLLPACPLMHGTGAYTSIECLAEGGRVVLLESRKFDAEELLDTIDRERVNGLVMVGDPFGRPILSALEKEPKRWDLTSLVGIISSGAMWSEEIKTGLLKHHAGMLLIDAFSSSEALGMGSSVSSAGGAAHTAEFTLGPEVKVLSEDGRLLAPGDGEVGVLAMGGRNPLGYYKDETKSAATFRTVDGIRYSIPGDYAEVHADGTIHLLGRGSVCINTAGEKVFPEEVEEVLKRHPYVEDAIVVGVPDEKFGEAIVGVVELSDTGRRAGVREPTVDTELIPFVKDQLASYKAPKRIRIVATIGRAPNGKLDYNKHKAEASEWTASLEKPAIDHPVAVEHRSKASPVTGFQGVTVHVTVEP